MGSDDIDGLSLLCFLLPPFFLILTTWPCLFFAKREEDKGAKEAALLNFYVPWRNS